MEKIKLHYAGFWRRLSASMVDILIMMPIFISLTYILGLDKYLAVEIDENLYSLVENKQATINRMTVDIITIFVISIYYILFIASEKKATIGKLLFGICVVDVRGKKITKIRAFARFILCVVLTVVTCGIAVIMIAFAKEKTALYDKICGTRVIRKTYNEEYDE